MPTPTIPTTSITFGHIKLAFPGVASAQKLGSYRGKHPSLPPSGPIKFSNFGGLTAVSPSLSLGAQSGTNVAMSATGSLTGTVGASQPGSLSYDLASFLQNSAYQGASTTYAVTVGALPTGVTLSAAGVLSVGTTTNTSGSVTVTVTVTNSYGNTSSVPLTFNLAAAAPAVATAQSKAYPPALTVSSTPYTFSGQTHGNGTYTMSISSGSPANGALSDSSNFNTYWVSSSTYTRATPSPYAGSATTTVSGVLG